MAWSTCRPVPTARVSRPSRAAPASSATASVACSGSSSWAWSGHLALVLGRSHGRSKPQRHLGRLHGLIDHAELLDGQGVQVDLLAQPSAEPLDGPGSVVAAAVEAPVDRVLNAAADPGIDQSNSQGISSLESGLGFVGYIS